MNTQNSVKVNNKNDDVPDKNFIVIDKDFMLKLRDLKQFIKDECGDNQTYGELMHLIREYLDEDKFLNWLNDLSVIKKRGPMSAQAKQKAIKILKGGK